MASSESVQLILKIVDKSSKEIKEIDKRLTQFDKTTKKTDRTTKSFEGSILKLGLAYVSLAGAINQTRAIVDAGLQFEQLEQKLTFATGSAAEAQATMAKLSKEADTLGLNALSSAQAFATLASVTKGTRSEGEVTMELFSGMAQASAALKLSVDDTAGALRQLGQIASKGKVQTEELMTIAERGIPIFRLSAEAMGTTTQELSKMLQKGEVLADDLLPRLGKKLQSEFGDAAIAAANSAQSGFNRFNNAVTQLRNTFAQSGILEYLKDAADGATVLIKAFQGWNTQRLSEQNEKLEREILAISEGLEAFTSGELARAPKAIKQFTDEIIKLNAEIEKNNRIMGKVQISAPIKDAGDKMQAVVKYTGDWNKNLKLSEQAALKVSKSLRDGEKSAKAWQDALADEQKLQDFADGIQGIFASTITDAVTQGLEGDIDPQALVKGMGRAMLQYGLMLQLTTESSILAGMAAAFSGGGAIIAGAALIGVANMQGGGGSASKQRRENVQERLNNIFLEIQKTNSILELQGLAGTAAVNELKLLADQLAFAKEVSTSKDAPALLGFDLNKGIGEILDFGTAFSTIVASIPGLTDKLNTAILESSSLFESSGLSLSGLADQLGIVEVQTDREATAFKRLGVTTEAEFTSLIKVAALAGNQLADAATDWEDLTTSQQDALIAVTNFSEEVSILGDVFGNVGGDLEDFANSVLGIGDITRNQQSFIDKNLGAIESSTDTVARLQARFFEEAEQAEALRDVIGTDATAEQIAQLAKEEQDVLNLGQQLIDKTKETFASTEQAESIIADVIRTVDQNQNNLLTVQETLLNINNTILAEVRDAIFAQNDILSAEVSTI